MNKTAKKSPGDKGKSPGDSPGYIPIRQGALLNEFAKLASGGGNALTVEADENTDQTTIKRGGMIITIRQAAAGVLSAAGRRLICHDHVLFDAIMADFTARPTASGEVALPLADLAKLRGVNDMKELRTGVWNGLDVFLNMQIDYSRIVKTKNGKTKDKGAHELRLIEGDATIKNSVLKVVLPAALRAQTSGVMPFPAALMRKDIIDPRYNPNTYYFGRKLAEHKHMNYGRANADTMSVNTLLKASPALPAYSAVKAGNSRHVTRAIIKPFMRDMDKLVTAGILVSWQLCGDDGRPLSADEKRGMKYKAFVRLKVIVSWANYPDQTARMQRIAERKAAAKQRKAEREARKLAKLAAKKAASGQPQGAAEAGGAAGKCLAASSA